MAIRNIFKIFLSCLFITTVIVFIVSNNFAIADAKETISNYGNWAPLIFLLILIAGTVLFMPGAPFDLLAGALFGTLFGFILIIIGSTAGAILAFYISRYLGRDFVEKLLNNRFKTVHSYKTYIEKHTFKAVLILRLIPLFPFNGLNFFLGLMNLKPRAYFLATFLGIMPAALIYVYLGESLASANMVNTIISVTLLLIFFAISYLVKRSDRFKNLLKTD